MYGGHSLVPEVVAVEEDVVDGMKVAAMWACGVVISSLSEPGGICGIKCVSGDGLESSGLVQARISCEDSVDEVGEG